MEGNDRDLIDHAEREDRERRDVRWRTGEMEVGEENTFLSTVESA